MVRYKINVLQALKAKGYSSYKLQKEKIISHSTESKLRNNDTTISLSTVNTICRLLECDINDILEYIPGDTEKDQ